MIADLLQIQVTKEIHCDYLTLTRISHTRANQAYFTIMLLSYIINYISLALVIYI